MHFDPADGSKPTQSTVKTGTLAAPPEKNPVREGFQFDGWTLDGQPFDFQTPVLQDTTLKAQWSKTTDWTLNPDHGPATGAQLTINLPYRQEPYYTSIQAVGEQTIALTGDSRIYTWTQDGTPKQVPFPAQAADGFRYLQAATGSGWQAALGSDQHIYTWTSQQSTPTILDASQNTQFTSISMKDHRLLAVDRKGQVHTYQSSNADSQNLNPKPAKQATLSLPRKTQAITAVASGSRILALNSDGQAWAWDANNAQSAEPERIRQGPDERIIQAQALNQGFLLLDVDGHAYYPAEDKNNRTTVSLPDSAQISRINSSGDQATIIDKDSHVWVWKPGETPVRADDGIRQYMQAVKAGNRITAISRQGGMFTWSLDKQGQPGKPTRINTAQASILESASMDGQSLKLSRNNDSWQTGIPARKPGPAAILISGRQDGQPFTRSLNYTVDQPLTRATEPRSTLTVRFDTGGGKPEPADQHFPTTNGRVKRPSPDPARDGFLFDGWFIGDVAYDFSRPVDKDLTLTAHWSPAGRNTKWSISPDKGSQLGREPTTITPPDSASRGIRFNQISGSPGGYFALAVGSDGNAYAWGYNWYGQLGDGTSTDKNAPVMVGKPAGAPADFTYLQVSAGDSHSLALGSDGNAYAWGNNSSGQLGDGTTTSYQRTPVMVGKPAGAPADFTYLQVSAGGSHSLAIGSDGNAYAWGNNSSGRIGDGTTTNRSMPVKVGKPAGLPADFTYVQVSAGSYHSLALGSDEYAYAWGDNGLGELGNNTKYNSSVPVRVRDPANPTDTSKGLKATQVCAGRVHSLALGNNGYAYAWGNNHSGQLGNNTENGLFDGNPVPVRVRDPNSPTDASKGLKVIQVSTGGNHSLAVGGDGYAYAWGHSQYGELGNNAKYNSSVPVRVRDPANPADTTKGLKATQVSGGGAHSLALGSDGNAWAWGNNQYGQLGNNSNTTLSTVPVPVSFNLALVITGVRFDNDSGTNLTRGDDNSVTVFTPAHQPGTVTVSVDYTLGGAPQTPDTSLRYTYLPAGVLPKAGGEGILLALATGMTGMGGILASRRHRREQHQLLHASHE